ncbi:MAG: zinc ABC transporter substrate-binding protein [Anaerolineales bacterium]|nr:zinc ABC transporter substrate-binding protein [Anaerolineales bacterium]
MRNRMLNITALVILALILMACNPTQPQTSSETPGKLKVVATTTIVGDVVSNVGDDLIDLTILLPIGTDPHAFDPNPQDVVKISDAEIIFINGAGLETFLEPLLENANTKNKVISVSEGIDLINTSNNQEEKSAANPKNSYDPHVWTDPNNTIVWVDNIEKALIEADPNNAAAYHKNAENYRAELHDLDQWIRNQVSQIPPENRNIITDHLIFAYFARRYDFNQIGAIISGYSTLAQPSAQELAALEEAIHKVGVRVILVGNTINPNLAERVAEDTGSQLVFIYTGSLSPKGDGASTYLDYIRYNVNTIVNALK